MFVSASFLGINYGVDDKIGKFFVDREPPKNNLYWKDKLLYLRLEAGWLFIPLIVDLLYKIGIEREQLLSEEFVGLMEQIGHISAEEELKLISKEEALNKCIDLVKEDHKNENYYNNLLDFMKGGTGYSFSKLSTPYKALHRGDAFLFSICALKFDDSLQNKIVETWFTLISTLLLLDDAEDLEEDKKNGNENAFIESGLTKEGIEEIKAFVAKNLRYISAINRPMALKLDRGYKQLLDKPYIQKLLN